MSLKQSQPKDGFSLLELLIYVSILSVIMIIISNTFISLSQGRGQAQAKSEVNSAIRFASELLKQDIKNASAVSTPASGTPGPTLTLTRGGVEIVYDVVGGVLRRKEGVAVPINVTNPNIIVNEPLFTKLENTNVILGTTSVGVKIRLNFSYNSQNSGWQYTDSMQTSVGLFQ